MTRIASNRLVQSSNPGAGKLRRHTPQATGPPTAYRLRRIAGATVDANSFEK